MSSYEKYAVTLRCVPEEGCTVALTPEQGACVRVYPVFAANREEALEKALAMHADDCDQPSGDREVTSEAELVTLDLVD